MFVRLRLATVAAVLIAITLSLSAVAPMALAQGVTTLTGNSTFDVNIRAAPGINSATIGVLPGGEKVTAIGRNSGNNWIQIQYGNTTGWVAAWLTVYSGDTALLTITSTVEPPPVGGPGPFTLTSPFNVNIRAEPRVNSTALGRLPFNAEAVATGRSESSSWVFIEYEGIQGWVAAWLTLLSGDTNALPVIGETGTAPTPGSVTPPPPPTDGSLIVQPPFRVNIRSEPSLSGAVIDVMPHTETATALGRNALGNWIQIEHNGTVGWVARWVVLSSDDTSTLPITSDSAEIAPFNGAITGRSIYEVIIRSGPGVNNGQIAVLPANTKAELLSRTEASNWIRLRYGDFEGWVAAWLIVASADMMNLPVE